MTVQALTKFNAGELTLLLGGQTDLAAYSQGLRRGRNVVTVAHGPAFRRSGTRRAGAAAPDSTFATRFNFGVGDAYAIEVRDFAFRFWRIDGTQVMAAGSPYEVVTPWTAVEAEELRWQESTDVIWFTHPNAPMQELRRETLAPNEVFTMVPADLQDGPYYAENPTPTTITLDTTGTGDMVATASAAVFDAANDVGRHFRIKLGVTGGDPDQQGWAWGKINAVSSPTVAGVTFVTTVSAAGPTASWRLGLYSAKTGFPSCVCIHQERLCLGGNPSNSFPRIDCSTSGTFLTFRPGTDDDDAIQIVAGTDEIPIIRDLVSTRVLVVITGSGVLRVTTSDTTTALTPLNIDIGPIPTTTGGANVRALKAQGNILYLDPQRNSLGEIRPTSDIYADSLAYREISIRNEHLFRDSPVKWIVWADKPWGMIVAGRDDGVLLIGTYAPSQEVINFTPHDLGGGGLVVSGTVLPTFQGNAVWLLVDRAGTQTMEVLTDQLRNTDPDRAAVNLDASITWRDQPAATLTRLSGADDAVQRWQADAAVFVSADAGKAVRLLKRGAVNDPLNMPTWCELTLRIQGVDPDNATITAMPEGDPIAGPLLPGTWTRTATVIPGFGVYEGQKIGVLADGGDPGLILVQDGKIALPFEASVVTGGLPYRSEFQAMMPAPQTKKGSALGRPTGAWTRARVVRTAGLKQVKFDGTPVGLRPLRRGKMPAAMAVPFYNGDLELEKSADSDTPVAPYLVATGSQPFCITGLAPDYVVGEMG